MKKISFAFTLVELVVAVTILAVLSTIWFISYSDYLWWVRDANRLSQIRSISDAFQVYNTHNLIPLPDNNVEVRLWNKIIWYQWYAWENILESIEYTWEWIDPKDNNYFTFNITSNRKYFSILSLLENEIENKPTVSVHNQLFSQNYQSRYPFVIGSKIWVLLDEQNIPIQEIPDIKLYGFIDIEDVWTSQYIALFDNDDSIKANGDWLIPLLPNYDCKRLKDFNSQLESWVYNIDPNGDNLSTWVYCDMVTDWWGWTITTMLGTQKYSNWDKANTNIFNTGNNNSITSLQYDIRDKWNLDLFWNDENNRDILLQCITSSEELKWYENPFIIYDFEASDKSNLTKLNKSWTIFSSKLLSARWKSHNYTLEQNYANWNESNGMYLSNYGAAESILYSLGYTLWVWNESNTPAYNNKSPAYYPNFSSWNNLFVDISADNFCYTATRLNLEK